MLFMPTVSVSNFKKQCLALLDNLEPDGIIITRKGKPVARLFPASLSCAELIGSMKDEIKINGDVFSTGLEWNAES